MSGGDQYWVKKTDATFGKNAQVILMLVTFVGIGLFISLAFFLKHLPG